MMNLPSGDQSVDSTLLGLPPWARCCAVLLQNTSALAPASGRARNSCRLALSRFDRKMTWSPEGDHWTPESVNESDVTRDSVPRCRSRIQMSDPSDGWAVRETASREPSGDSRKST
jgi:hypothetical protein